MNLKNVALLVVNGLLLVVNCIWNLPLSIWSLVVICFGGAEFSHFQNGYVPLFLLKRDRLAYRIMKGYDAFAVGACIFVKPESARSQRLITHELRHITQGWFFGPLMPIIWVLNVGYTAARGGHYYRDNWFEVDARRHTDEVHQAGANTQK